MQSTVLFVSTGSHHDVRLHKVVGSLRGKVARLHLCGIRRSNSRELPQPPLGLTVTLVDQTRQGRFGLAMAMLRLRSAVGRFLKAEAGRCTIYLINEECVCLLPWWFAFGRNRIVLDLYDSLFLRLRGVWKWGVALPISRFAWWTASTIVVTDDRRHALLPAGVRGKAVIVENFPRYEGSPEPSLPKGPATVLVTGSLSEGRGLRQLLTAAQGIPNFRIVAAGYLHDRYAREVFATSPIVDYRGLQAPDDALALYLEADAVFAYYAPTNTNNRFASPNKLYEAIRAGRRIIMNAEVQAASDVTRNGWGWAVPFSDTNRLADVLRELIMRRNELSHVGGKMRDEGREKYSWESQESSLTSVIFPDSPSELGGKK